MWFPFISLWVTNMVLLNLVGWSKGLSVARQTTNSTTDCANLKWWCSLKDSPVKQYVWVPVAQAYQPHMVAATVDVTATIVMVVNTALDETTVITETPPPTLTNSLGTRTEQITYTTNGQTLTTDLPYPTDFFVWPPAYTWYGTVVVSDGPSTCSVSTALHSQAVPVPTGPQPTHFAWQQTWNQTLVAEDPQGLDFVLMRDWSDWQWAAASSYFPRQPAVTSCYPENPGPNWGGFTQTNWYTATATRTVS